VHDENDSDPDQVRRVEGGIPVVFDPLGDAGENRCDPESKNDRDEDDNVFKRAHYFV
jgi:hypothetical protein